MPVLTILGGPNGVGKTTFFNHILETKTIEAGIPFINVDNIARSLGGYNDANISVAANIARSKIGEYFSAGRNFIVESNLASCRDYEWIESVKKAGWTVELFLINTNSVVENISRIQQRVLEGGHHIPAHIAKDRARMLEVYIKPRFDHFSHTRLIDTSGDTAIDCGRLEGNKIVDLPKNVPNWVVDVLHLLLRLPENLHWKT